MGKIRGRLEYATPELHHEQWVDIPEGGRRDIRGKEVSVENNSSVQDDEEQTMAWNLQTVSNSS